MALFEYRVYEAVPGKLPALNRRFQTITLGYFQKYGIGVVGFWEAIVGTTNELHYILRYDSLAHREQAWGAFQADEGWARNRAETERDGPLVARVRNQFWRATEYSPLH
ncbi:MAG TPA: NIPSNAP family protein [Chloroflexota bacterium]|nr:NIPSNAP family protein [Chloroflexota bacterium]